MSELFLAQVLVGSVATEQAVRTFDERGASRINPLAITQLNA